MFFFIVLIQVGAILFSSLVHWWCKIVFNASVMPVNMLGLVFLVGLECLEIKPKTCSLSHANYPSAHPISLSI